MVPVTGNFRIRSYSSLKNPLSTIKQILDQTAEQGVKDILAMEVWLAFLLGQDRLFIFKNYQLELNNKVEQAYWDGIHQMADGKPLSQLTGSKEFYGLSFVVDGNVLIPRPESELLVDLAREYIKENADGKPVMIADIGTGSGAILLSILKNVPEATGIGTDISGKALEIARQNASALQLEGRVSWVEGDLLLPVDTPCQVVVANLPYIGRDRFNFVAENVAKYEPDVALYGGSNGLEMYERMFLQLKNKGWFPGLVAGEFGFGQDELMEFLLFENFPDKKFRIIPDLAGIPRVFVLGS